MRKVDIRDRIWELDRRLKSRQDTLVSQSDERDRLMQACETAGDHVMGYAMVGGSVTICCEFCHASGGLSLDEISRNLQRA